MNTEWTPTTTFDRLLVKTAMQDPSVKALVHTVALYKVAAEGDKPQAPAAPAAPAAAPAADKPADKPAEKGDWEKFKEGLDKAWQANVNYFRGPGNDKDGYAWSGLKDYMLGTGAGLGVWGLTGLLPNAKKQRGMRLLLSLLAGSGAVVAGPTIRAQFRAPEGSTLPVQDPSLAKKEPAPAAK